MVETEDADHAHGSPKWISERQLTANKAIAQNNGGARPGAGHIRKSRLLSTNKFREICIKHGPRALEIIAEIAEHGEPDLARFAAAKFIIERGYGVNPDDAPGATTVVNPDRRSRARPWRSSAPESPALAGWPIRSSSRPPCPQARVRSAARRLPNRRAQLG
jgi:hypothetical protein